MKRIFFIVLLLPTLILVTSCKSKGGKKEAAKNYLKEQTSGKEDVVDTVSLMDYNGKVQIITDKTFDQFISKGIVFMDFWATWCKPCILQSPIVEELASELGAKVRFGKMDVDKNNEISELLEIVYLPTLMIFKDGKMVEKMQGFQTKENLQKSLEKFLK